MITKPAAHTATPWSAIYHMTMPNGDHMYVVRNPQGVPLSIGVENTADAAFIVLACNAHDELVEALHKIVNMSCIAGTDRGDAGIEAVARAALTKVSL